MRRRLSIPWSILVGLIVIGGAWAYARGGQSDRYDPPGPPGRAQWVPFSARLERVTPDGSRFVGRFFRRSDGSTRHESGYTLDKVERITINNIQQVSNYKWAPSTGWVAATMILPTNGWRPFTPSVGMLARLKPSADIEGFAVLRRDRDDYVEFLAPKLDMFCVRMQWKSCSNVQACGTWYTDIKVGEPPDELFDLPLGVPVDRSFEPGGIYPSESRPGGNR